MLWSLIKILLFIGVAAALTWGAGLILETPGEVRIAFAGQEVAFSPLGFVIALILVMIAAWIILKFVGLLVAILRFVTGDQTALTRYFDRNRERRGFDALSQSLIAMASGDARRAQIKAMQAEKLLNRPDVTRLLSAQTAEMNGDRARALAYYKEMLNDDATRFVAVQGLLKQKLDEGDTETALKLAEKAFALKPRHEATLDTLFGLQTGAEDWAGARRTLSAKVRAASLPKDVGRRREAVLSVADARAALAIDEWSRAREAAYAANKLAPGFVPAAALAAELHARADEGRQAAKIIKRAWADNPHPDLAAAFAAIVPDETPEQRLKRFQPLLKIRADDPETRLVSAELHLAAEDFPGARRALGTLAETAPTTRSLALMAAVERGEGAPDSVVRGWLAKALEAPRGEAWICQKCKTAHGQWAPICDTCDGFDTLSWELPPSGDTAGGTAAMLPLIVGALQRPGPEPEQKPQAGPEDAETPDEPKAGVKATGKATGKATADAPRPAEEPAPKRETRRKPERESDQLYDAETPGQAPETAPEHEEHRPREPVRTPENIRAV